MTTVTQSRDNLLRQALRANALFCAASGLLFILMSAQIAAFLAVSPDAWLVIDVTGGLLLGWAAIIVYHVTRPVLQRPLNWLVIGGDVLWVIGSVVLLAFDPFAFSTAGRWAVLIVADVVTVFAIAQYIGLRRL